MCVEANAAHISASLRKALRPASSHRWVAEWLFSSPSNAFHLAPTLPPNFLRLSLAVQSSFTILLRSTPEHPLPFTSRACDMLFVPVAEADGCVTGYSLDRGDKVQDARIPLPAPFDPPFICRFAFDTVSQDLLLVTAPGPSPLIGIVAMNTASPLSRNHLIFTVPAHDYSFGNLPSTALSMYSNVEYRLDPFSSSKGIHSNDETEPPQTLTSAQPPVYENTSSRDGVATDSRDGVATVLSKSADWQNFMFDSPRLMKGSIETDSFLSDLLPNTDGLHSPLQTTLTNESVSSASSLMDPISCLPINDDAGGLPRKPPLPHTWQEIALPLPELQDQAVDCTSPSVREVASHLPWFVSSTGTTADGLSPSLAENFTDTSSGSFSASKLSSGVATLCTALRGKYYGPCVRMDMLHTVTGKYNTFFTGKINYSVKKLEGQSVNALERHFADKYYLAALAVTTDRLLIHDTQVAATIQMANEHFMSNSTVPVDTGLLNDETAVRDREAYLNPSRNMRLHETGIARTPKTSEVRGTGVSRTLFSLGSSAMRPLAPAPLNVHRSQAQENGVEMKDGGAESQELLRRRLAEGRRKRNRLSAARSNMRRREKARAEADEIERNRKTVEELTKRKHAMINENERLRSLIAK